MDFLIFNIKVNVLLIAVLVSISFFPGTPTNFNSSLNPGLTVDIFTPSLLFVDICKALSL